MSHAPAPIDRLPETVQLPASKSLANRALVIQALAPARAVTLDNVSAAEDTQTLAAHLGRVADGVTLDCGPAGTTLRFLAAYLCTQPGVQVLTGSARMLERPIGPLVEALRTLGATVDYLGAEGYPPLRVGGFGESPVGHAVTLPGDISSQYLSALLLVGPVLPQGLTLRWTGQLVSRPYVEMTIALMREFGAEVDVDDSTVRVAARRYSGGHYRVEADWSAASYVAAHVAIARVGTTVYCPGLLAESLQGDRVTADMIRDWGVETAFDDGGARFRKTGGGAPATFERDFTTCPDLAQTFAVLCGVTGATALYTGLETLGIKETDRVAALKAELAKVDVYLSKLPPHFSPDPTRAHYMQEGRASVAGPVALATYADHRMAMSMALLLHLGPVTIEHPAVVRKSWPDFWEAMGYGQEVTR